MRIVNIKHTLANIGENVFYNGREATILSLIHLADGTPAFGLEDKENEEYTCVAKEQDCITMYNWWYGDAKSKSGIQY